jgi:hypothetical protein
MPELLLDARTEPDVVTIPARKVLAYEGRGAPEGEAFQKAFGALYGVGYTLKFARKASGHGEFKIGPVEGRWWSIEAGTDGAPPPRESWCWRLRLAVPDDVSEAEVAASIRAATSKKGGKLSGSAEAQRVTLEHVGAQRVGRALQVGPYADEPRTFAAIARALATAGLEPAPSHVEIYLSDPRRTAPARLRTVLLRETR